MIEAKAIRDVVDAIALDRRRAPSRLEMIALNLEAQLNPRFFLAKGDCLESVERAFRNADRAEKEPGRAEFIRMQMHIRRHQNTARVTA